MARGQTKRRRSASEDVDEYASDDGFVADAPKSKKSKAASSTSKSKSQASAKAGGSGSLVDDRNNKYWELSPLRRVTLSEWKGKMLINIREYYEKDGEMAPGNKGIALTTDQFTALIGLLPQIETTLKASGVNVPRPNYAESGNAGEEDQDGDSGEAVGEDDEEAEVDQDKKRNIDTTSDEGED